MRGLAVKLAGLAFFALALTGWASGQAAFTCAMRSLGGAVAFYVVLRLAGKMAMSILVDAVAKSQAQSADVPAGRERSDV